MWSGDMAKAQGELDMKTFIKEGQRAEKFVDCEVKADPGNERAFWFTASTEDRDRDGDIMVAKGWRLKEFKKNPVILFAHKSTELPVGKALDVKVEDGRLRMLVEFATADINPLGEQVFQAVKRGFLKTMSVGFMPWKVEPLTEEDKTQRPEMSWGRRISAELLESSVVPVPANPAALQGRAGKEFGELVLKGMGHLPERREAPIMENPLLPFRDSKGATDARLLRASVALVLGARGGISLLPEEERKACFNLLVSKAEEAEVDAPSEWRAYGEDELRTIFKDVWHEELLSLRLDVQAEEDKARASAEAARQEEKVAALAEGWSKSLKETSAALSSLAGRLQ